MKQTIQPVSDKFSPTEIKNKEFKKTVWGYSPPEVVEFLDFTAKTWERVQKHEKDLIREIQVLQEELQRWKDREAELGQLTAQAEQEAQKIRADGLEEAKAYMKEAKERAEEVRVKTEEWLATVIEEVEETERRRDAFVSTLRNALDQHYALLNDDADGNGIGEGLDRFLSTLNKKPNGSRVTTHELS